MALAAGVQAAGVFGIGYNPDTGDTWLMNVGDEPLQFSGYQFVDLNEPGRLRPDRWVSITDSAIVRPDVVLESLGNGGLSFDEESLGSAQIAEVNQSGAADLDPGELFWIGHPFPDRFDPFSIPPVETEGLSFDATGPLGNFTLAEPLLIRIPEPATAALTMIGAFSLFALVRRHRYLRR